MENQHSKTLNGNMLPFALALVLMVGFLLFIGKVVWCCPQNLDLLKTLSAIFLGPIGTILGFYFGHRPAEKLEERVRELIASNTDMIRQLEQRRNELDMERKEATTAAKKLLERMERAESVIQRIENYVG